MSAATAIMDQTLDQSTVEQVRALQSALLQCSDAFPNAFSMQPANHRPEEVGAMVEQCVDAIVRPMRHIAMEMRLRAMQVEAQNPNEADHLRKWAYEIESVCAIAN